MTGSKTTERLRVVDVIEKYGKCVELVPLDPNFNDISVGLYVKDGTGTVWTFYQKPGVEERIRQIRDQLVALGGMVPIEGTHNQVKFPCGVLHSRPTKFLMMQTVEKDPSFSLPEGDISIKDLKSPLMLKVQGNEVDGRCVYTIDAEGEAPNKTMRIVGATAGFVRYGEMEKIDNDTVAFKCGYRHDELMRLLISYARNVSGVEDMLEADALRGQMTTGTLGFTPPT